MSDLVSVVMPVYNAEAFIARAIRSVLQQTYTHFELLVIDDGSTDNSLEILKSFLSDTRINLYYNTIGKGVASTRNLAISKAKGRYIAFLDSDDSWFPTKLEKQVAFMQTHNYQLSYTQYQQVNEQGKFLKYINYIPSRLDYNDALKKNYIGCLTAMYDAQTLGKQYMPEIPQSEDFGLWLSILKKTDAAYCVKEVLASYTIRNKSLSNSKLRVLKHDWHLYRNIEKLSWLSSVYYLSIYTYRVIYQKFYFQNNTN